MREAPNKAFTIAELTQCILILNKILIYRPKNILIPFVNNWMSFIKENGLIEFKSAEWCLLAMENKNSGISTAIYYPCLSVLNRQCCELSIKHFSTNDLYFK